MSTETTTAPEEAVNRRKQVLELTGWGLPFRFWQPHNLCFWVFTILTVLGGVHLFQYFSAGGASVVGVGIGVGATSTALYGLIFILILRLGDHYERQPAKLVVTAFIWGALPATFLFAVTANNALLDIYPKLFGQAFVNDWGPALAAPFTEETSKAAGFILLIGLAPRLIRTPYDGVFIGAFIGLGFQLFEDVLYDFNTATQAFGFDQVHQVLATFGLRAASGIFSHALYTAIFCCGLIYLIGSPLQKRRVGLGLSLMLVAMIAHGAWDGVGAIGGASGVAGIAAMLFSAFTLVLLFYILSKTAGSERDYLRAILQPEVDRGTITSDELDAVCASRRQRRKFVHSGKGHKSHHNAKHLIRSSFDLAHEIAKAGGEDSPGVEHERNEIARLRTANA